MGEDLDYLDDSSSCDPLGDAVFADEGGGL